MVRAFLQAADKRVVRVVFDVAHRVDDDRRCGDEADEPVELGPELRDRLVVRLRLRGHAKHG